MNDAIKVLKDLKEQKSRELRKLEADLETLINQETHKLRKVMENNPLDIIKFIEGYGLKCYAFKKDHYFITDKCYDVKIQVSQGDIVIDDDDLGITASYIRKERINLLGRNKFFLRQLTPISEEEFNKALNDITDTIKQISKNIKDDKNIVLKCPKCNSTGPLSQGTSMTTTVYYPPVWENGVNINPDGNITRIEFICEKCGCKFSARFKHGKCISIKEN